MICGICRRNQAYTALLSSKRNRTAPNFDGERRNSKCWLGKVILLQGSSSLFFEEVLSTTRSVRSARSLTMKFVFLLNTQAAKGHWPISLAFLDFVVRLDSSLHADGFARVSIEFSKLLWWKID